MSEASSTRDGWPVGESLRRASLRSALLQWAALGDRSRIFCGLQRRLETLISEDHELIGDAVERALGLGQGGVPGQRFTAPIQAVLIKPMGDTCDLRCTYCYEIHDGKRTTMRRMAPATLERAIAAALDQAHRRLAFLWHGGEPTLAGISFYAAAMEMQRRLNTRGVEITNSIQSHGLRLDDDWIPFILKHQFSVGISLDGPQDLHDLSRVELKRSADL